MSKVRSEIFRHWVHSREEDTEGIKVYRPNDYDFPPARGREGFEIKENGEFIRYDIAPDDRLKAVAGRWRAESENRIIVELGDGRQESFVLNIVSVDNDILKIKFLRS